MTKVKWSEKHEYACPNCGKARNFGLAEEEAITFDGNEKVCLTFTCENCGSVAHMYLKMYAGSFLNTEKDICKW